MGRKKITKEIFRYFFLITFTLAMMAMAYGVHRLGPGKGEKFFEKRNAQR